MYENLLRIFQVAEVCIPNHSCYVNIITQVRHMINADNKTGRGGQVVSALEIECCWLGSLCCDSSPVVQIQCAARRFVKSTKVRRKAEEKTSSLPLSLCPCLSRPALQPRDLPHAFTLTMSIYWKTDEPLVSSRSAPSLAM